MGKLYIRVGAPFHVFHIEKGSVLTRILRGDTMLNWIEQYTLTNIYFVSVGIPSILVALWFLAVILTFRAEKKGK